MNTTTQTQTIEKIMTETLMSAQEINDYTSRFLTQIINESISYTEGDLLKAKFLNHYTGMMI